MKIGKAPTLTKAIKPHKADFKILCDQVHKLKPNQALIIDRTDYRYSPVTLKLYLQIALQARNIEADVWIDWKANPVIQTYIYKLPKD